jgi:hypothetical protein
MARVPAIALTRNFPSFDWPVALIEMLLSSNQHVS